MRSNQNLIIHEIITYIIKSIDKTIVQMFSNRQSQKYSPTMDTASNQQKSTIKTFDPNNESYFHMMQIVGSSGRYQNISLTLWCVIWFIAGQILLGTPFLLYNPPYQNCPQNFQQICDEYVCSLPVDQRAKFTNPQFNSLAMQFGDYHCENSYKIQLTQTLVYFGSFVGYLVVSWMNDNLGRKKSIMIGLIMSLLGLLLISASSNLFMAQVGMFLAGFGIDPSINTVFYFIGETVENNLRQKHSTIVQFFFSLAGIVNVINYLIFKNWRLIFWLFFFIPAAIAIFLIWRLIQQTPQFMIMFHTPKQTIQALKKIALVNNSEFFQSQQNQQLLFTHIQKLKHTYHQKQSQSQKRYMNFWDMFRYPSIRYISLYVCILSFNIYLMYYGPLMLMEKYHLNVFVSAVVITSSDIIVYPIVYFFVQRMKRKMWGKLLFGLALTCSVGLFFVTSMKDDFWKVIQMILIFIFRFAISFYFVIFAIYSTELFPSQIKGIAIGFASALGTVASTSSPIIFGELQKTSFPVMIIFVFLGAISFLSTFYLPQTLNAKLSQQLQEFGEDLDQEKESAGNGKNIELVQQMGEIQINSKNQYIKKIME